MIMTYFKFVLCSFFCFSNLLVVADSINFNVTVSLDGSGNYRSISEAVASAPNNSKTRFYIRVTPGTYHERLVIPSTKTFIALVGDDPFTTIIVDHRSNGTGYVTNNTATITIKGANFMAQYLTFENSAGAGPQVHQAVAVLGEADYSAYYKCRFLGFQDTLYAQGQYQFFKECDIYGSVDFIFGAGRVVFQDCNIYARLVGTEITITAQSKTSDTSISGYSFQNCTITSSPETVANKKNFKVYLGRPWKPYSSVVFMESFLGDVVAPEGWLEWPGVPVNLLFYAEFNNQGPGANVSKRVNWPGYHVIDKQLANTFTVDNFINGSKWLPETGILLDLDLFPNKTANGYLILAHTYPLCI